MASVNAPSPSASLSPPNSSVTPPSGSSSPSNFSAPPPQAPPTPAIPAAPPQSPPLGSSPPPPSSPAPSTSVSPPPPTPVSPPPPTPVSPPLSPTVTPPPESPTTPPPIANSPPPPVVSTPPPPIDSPPPQESPVPPPPVVVSPPSPSVSTSPPPPPSPSPPSPVTPPTERTPPPPALPPSPTTSSRPPPPSRNPPPTSIRSPPPPPSVPSSLPPSVSPAPQGNSSVDAPPTSSPIPRIPTEKPTAQPTPNTRTGASTNTTGSGGGGLKAGPVAAIGIVVGFLALSLVIFAVWFVQKRKKKSTTSKSGFIMPSPSSQNSDSHFLKHQYSVPSPYNSVQLAGSAGGSKFAYSPDSIGNSRSWFTYQELATATNGFSSNNLLGEGGFGCVYKGILTDGREVAVKQLKAGGGQGEREFRAEVEIISRVHHRHLVSLVGYCIYEHQRILVYDFVPNDTLHHHLHGESRVMDWAARIKFAAGAARGIAYLHEDCNPRIIHRDIKSANILLDENFEAKVADFGLAKLMELSEQTHVSTRVMGTFGYMAPEYATSGKLTEKSDVFSFGVVLLELITGRKPVDVSQPVGDESLVEWARPLMTEALENGSFRDLVDPRLENFVEGEMLRMIETAAVCVRHSASKRPRMSQVVRALDMIDESGDITNGMKPGQSQVYDSREQSAQIRMFHRMAFGSQGFSIDSFSNSQSSWKSRNDS